MLRWAKSFFWIACGGALLHCSGTATLPGGSGSQVTLPSSGGSQATSPPMPGDPDLLWSDEFDGTVMDPNRWAPWTIPFMPPESQAGGGGWSTSTYDANNVSVANGVMHLKATPAPSDIYAWNPRRGQTWGPYTYFAGEVDSRIDGKSVGWQGGHFEARMKVPCGNGVFPSIWMAPVNGTIATQNGAMVGWPTTGEIDIMEHRGVLPQRFYNNVHFGGPNGEDLSNDKIIDLAGGARVCDDFHVFAVDWTADSLRYTTDGVETHRFERNSRNWWPLSDWPFNQPFYITMGLGIGGWASVDDQGNKQTLPTTETFDLQVDYVRVYHTPRS